MGRKRVLDSTALYDAVATMDTVTLVRSAIRGLLKVAGGELEARLRAVLARDDDYAGAGKPVCDYDDAAARAGLVDALARDGMALLAVLDGRELSEALAQAAALLATVLGQDLDQDEAGVFRIARRVAKDRVISTVDPDTRHGHKTAARGFDGYKGHVGIDPDTEIITATTVTAGNAGDASVAEDLITDLLDTTTPIPGTRTPSTGRAMTATVAVSPPRASTATTPTAPGNYTTGWNGPGSSPSARPSSRSPRAGASPRTASTSTCATTRCAVPPGTPHRSGAASATGAASFWPYCTHCPLRQQCTTAPDGRTITVGIHERQLADARARQRDPDWITDYRATRPKVERKIAHLMRRRHGGRRARVRGTDQDRRRLRPARRRRQPRTPRSAGRGQRPRIRMGHRDPMSRAGR